MLAAIAITSKKAIPVLRADSQTNGRWIAESRGCARLSDCALSEPLDMRCTSLRSHGRSSDDGDGTREF